MQKIIYTNERGQSIKLTNTKPFFLRAIEGTGAVGTDVQMQKAPFQDGASYIDTLLEPRYLTLEVVLLSENQTKLYEYRQQLSKIFNPKLKGTIKYINNNTEKILPVVVEKAPVWGKTRLNVQPCMINLIAPSPFWLDIIEYKEKIAVWLGDFGFELEIPEEGIVMGHREPSLIVNVNNEGDVETGMRIEFKALATIKNPSLFNVNTRKFIKINKTMSAGEVITITTDFGNKRVESILNGVTNNAFNYIDLNSTFLQLDLGDNLLRYDADENVDNLEVSIYYTPKYVGV